MMSLFWLFVIAIPLLSADLEPPPGLRLEGAPRLPAALLEEIAPYANFRSANLHDWHPERRAILITTRFADVPQVHSVQATLGMRRQLTFLREAAVEPLYRPRGHGDFVFLSDRGGGEFYQIFFASETGGRPRLLTDGASRNTKLRWSPDGRWLGFSSTRRDGRHTDIWIMDPAQPERARLVLASDGPALSIADWSDDGQRLLVLAYTSVEQSQLFEVELSSGVKRALTGNQAAIGGTRYGPAGSVLLITDQGSDFRRLARLEPKSGRLEFPRPDSRWDIEALAISSDKRWIAIVHNEAGFSRLEILDARSFRPAPHQPQLIGVVDDPLWRPGHAELAFSLTNAHSPKDVFTFDVETGKLERWTQSETGGVDATSLPLPELIRWKSFDGLEITGLLYRPPARFSGPRPVMIVIHGGPEGQSLPEFLGRQNYLLRELGIALIYPNVRGSTGFGKRFVSLDNGRRREDAVRDIGSLLDWITRRPDLDRNRIIVRGGSYGGYMTLASMTHYNHRLCCAIESVGISNWVTFLERTEAYRRDRRRVEYGDERDPDMRQFLERISPLNHVDKITKPMLILQGKNDPRVHYLESEQMVRALQKRSVPVWYLLAEDEGHGFRRKANQDYAFGIEVLFLRQYLLR